MKLFIAAFLPFALLASRAFAEESGEQVYQRVCSACHGTKFDKAPQLGDRKAWASRIARGQHQVTAHAWFGVNNMPPRGGDPTLTLEAFARAAAYMARQAGGKWRDPDAKMMARIEAEVKKHGEHGHSH